MCRQLHHLICGKILPTVLNRIGKPKSDCHLRKARSQRESRFAVYPKDSIKPCMIVVCILQSEICLSNTTSAIYCICSKSGNVSGAKEVIYLLQFVLPAIKTFISRSQYHLQWEWCFLCSYLRTIAIFEIPNLLLLVEWRVFIDVVYMSHGCVYCVEADLDLRL